MTTAALSSKALEEIQHIADRFPETTSFVATGSIVEGLGNQNSDIDLYAISEGSPPGQTTAIGIRESQYIDCEYMRLASVAQLCERVSEAGWAGLETLSLRELDRFYRIAISIPVRVSDTVAAVLDGFSQSVACHAFGRYAVLRAYEHTCRAACALANGADIEALVFLREGALWHAAARLAEAGEGYPSLKWTGEKAARRFGRDTAAFDELLEGYLRPGRVQDAIPALRSRISVPDELLELTGARAGRLADGVRLIDDEDDVYLVKPGGSMLRVPAGPAATVCRHLAAGLDWSQATGATAAAAGLPTAELATAVWCGTQNLRIHEFLCPCS